MVIDTSANLMIVAMNGGNSVQAGFGYIGGSLETDTGEYLSVAPFLAFYILGQNEVTGEY